LPWDIERKMLGKGLVKRLKSQKWIDAMKYGDNPTQTWTRTKIQVDRAIDHLTLLADKAPDEKQEEIFNEKKFFKLFRSLLKPHDLRTEFETQPHLDGRRVTLAKTLVQLGTDVCVQQYRLIMKDTPDLAEPIISVLKQSAAICEDIAYRSELMERDMKAEKQAMVYLFEWGKIARSKYQRRLEQFILNELKEEGIQLESVIYKNSKNIQGTFKLAPFEEDPSWSFTLRLEDADLPTYAGFKVFDGNGDERASKMLVVKKDHDSISVYAKKKN
jgi:hypothetical protein